MRIAIKGCKIFDRGDSKFDIIIEEDRIKQILPSVGANYSGFTEIEAGGLVALPGLFDIHCHLREPGYEYKEGIESGTKAAARGGFTSVACMSNTMPPADTASVIRYIIERAGQYGYCKVYPIACITKGQKGEELAEFGDLKEAGAVAFSDDGLPVENPLIMRNALLYAKSHGALIISHCEDKRLSDDGCANEGYNATIAGIKGIPAAAEEVMVARDVILAASLNARLHIAHVSTKGSVEIIRQAKKNGVKVTCETCPHYFAADDSLILDYNANAKVNPPLRGREDVEAVIEGIKDGTIDAIATDHAPHHADDKNVEFCNAANGISGLETALSLSYTHLVKAGHIALSRLAQLMSAAPARILGLEPRELSDGRRADIALVDFESSFVIDSSQFLSKGKNTPFNGQKVYGAVACTINEGRIVYQDIMCQGR